MVAPASASGPDSWKHLGTSGRPSAFTNRGYRRHERCDDRGHPVGLTANSFASVSPGPAAGAVSSSDHLALQPWTGFSTRSVHFSADRSGLALHQEDIAPPVSPPADDKFRRAWTGRGHPRRAAARPLRRAQSSLHLCEHRQPERDQRHHHRPVHRVRSRLRRRAALYPSTAAASAR